MANWCSNSVVFLAAEEKRAAIHTLFADIELKQKQDNRYHLPSFATDERGFMSDIVINDRGLNFETRWTPNLKLLMEIADFYNAGFVSRFEEMQTGMIGEARYEQGTLTAVTLDQEDFKAICRDILQQGYPLRFFDNEGDLLDYILEQKELSDRHIQVYQRHEGLENGRT